MYIHAGCPTSGRLPSLHSFDLQSKTWKQLADAPGPGRGGTALAVCTLPDSSESIFVRFAGAFSSMIQSCPINVHRELMYVYDLHHIYSYRVCWLRASDRQGLRRRKHRPLFPFHQHLENTHTLPRPSPWVPRLPLRARSSTNLSPSYNFIRRDRACTRSSRVSR